MSPDQYRSALASLNLSQRAAAKVIKIDERTSRKYAANGVPERSVAFVMKALNKYSQANKANGKGGESDEQV